MAHSVEIPYLDKENIEIYLNDLATEIEKAKIGKHCTIDNVLKFESEKQSKLKSLLKNYRFTDNI